MKALASFHLLLLGILAAHAQGTVNFVNDSAILSSPPDRLIRLWDGTPAVGTNFQVQLYYGASTAAECALIPVSSPPARLRASTTQFPGTWSGGGSRTLNGFDYGSGLVKLQVRVWDIAMGATFEQAVLMSGGGFAVRSALFLYQLPASPLVDPTNFVMANFTGFILDPLVNDPPPGTYSLSNQIAALGDTAVFSVPAGNPSYVWRFNGSPIAGATTNSLTLTNVQPAQAGNYAVTVSNCFGQAFNGSATLSVILPRLVIRKPNANQIQVAWLTNLNSYVIETASNLTSAPWEPVGNSPAVQGGEFILTESPSAAQKFFRLRRP